MIVKNGEAKKFVMADGIVSKIMGHGGTMMIVENTFVKGANAKIHEHEHEQDGYVVSGSFEFIIGDEKFVFNAGDSFYISPSIPHGCTALENGVIIDAFSPQREDFLDIAK
jgi:quercetin dioxygenase-like cupin family protein